MKNSISPGAILVVKYSYYKDVTVDNTRVEAGTICIVIDDFHKTDDKRCQISIMTHDGELIRWIRRDKESLLREILRNHNVVK